MIRIAPVTARTVEESYEDRYEHAACGLLSTDERGAIVEVNATFLAWSRYPVEALVDQEFSQLLAVGSRLFWETRCLPVLRLEGSVREVAVNLVCHDGSTLPVLLNCSIQDVSGGDGQHTHIALFDATQRTDYERELLTARRVAKWSAARVQVLQQASYTFDAASSVTAIADGLAETARGATDAGSAAVLLTEPGRRQRGTASSAPHPFGEAAPRDDAGPEADAMRSGEVVALVGIDALERAYPARAAGWYAARIESLVAVPLQGGEGGHGVLLCGFGRRREFADNDLELLQALARQAVQALQRLHLQEQLRHQAMHDRLTGLANRTLLQQRLEQALAAADRHRRPLALVFVDLDEFKPINDRLGHAAGDAVLVQVAARLQEVSRTTDTVARFGGDEFVVLCEDTDATTVRPLAERIRSAVAEPLTGPAKGCSVGASIGVAVHVPGAKAIPDPDAVLRTADNAMYAAKHAGKDRVHITSLDPGTGADASSLAGLPNPA